MRHSNRDKAMDMARYAYQTVPIYYNFAEKNKLNVEKLSFEDVPITDKSFFLEKGMSILSTQFIGKYLQNKLHYTRTSGSTGKCTEVFWDVMQERKSLLSLWLYRKQYYGITPKDKLCYFFPDNDGSKTYYEKGNRVAISKMLIAENKLEQIFDIINHSQPTWMILQPSIASMMCEYVERNDIEISDSIRYIEFTGEYLDVSVRKKVKDIFCCKVANQYGSKEVNSIAYECPEGNLHVMENNVFLEVLGDGEEGEICLTTLQNKAMPLIKFNIGDRGKLKHDINCSCGNKSAVLELKAGRSNDWILRKDGTKVHAYQLMQIVQKINQQMDGEILQYQIVQKDWDFFVFYLVIDEEELKKEITELLCDEVKKSMGESVEVEIQYFNHLIIDKNTGKLACFRCEISLE